MNNHYIDEPLVEAFIFETNQIVETLEQIMINCERSGAFSEEEINEIFRLMHTIKGSAAMMMYSGISALAHKLEDIFYVIREDKAMSYDFSGLVDLILESIDFFKIELMKIKEGDVTEMADSHLLDRVTDMFNVVKGDQKLPECHQTNQEQTKYYVTSDKKVTSGTCYYAKILFKEACEMENIRAYTVIHNLSERVEELFYHPDELIEDDKASEKIRDKGFEIVLKSTETYDVLNQHLDETLFLESLTFEEIELSAYEHKKASFQTNSQEDLKIPASSKLADQKQQIVDAASNGKQSIISVNVDKLDSLMDMVGELVIAEAMVTQNPEVVNLEIESFEKSSRLLHKITGELQDLVMSIRMVPLSTTFLKMHRIVRDMTRKLDKHVQLEILGEETEVDKNIIEKISDPLMHIIRNAMDHGIETEEDRLKAGKPIEGTVHLEAKNSGSDVLIVIKDDGKGLNKKTIYDKALRQGLIEKAYEDMTERELHGLILKPGFSTKEEVTEFSGRGVGMDVVSKNISEIGGSVIVDSQEGIGTSITLKIPLTLAIIEGMNIKVGESRFTIPIVSIQESFRPADTEVITDTTGQEMIIVRGDCYPILRLHQFYGVDTQVNKYSEGILIMVEEDDYKCCIFADELLGQQQVVIKSLPEFIKKYKKIQGLSGCTLLGDGNISLILDVGDLKTLN